MVPTVLAARFVGSRLLCSGPSMLGLILEVFDHSQMCFTLFFQLPYSHLAGLQLGH